MYLNQIPQIPDGPFPDDLCAIEPVTVLASNLLDFWVPTFSHKRWCFVVNEQSQQNLNFAIFELICLLSKFFCAVFCNFCSNLSNYRPRLYTRGGPILGGSNFINLNYFSLWSETEKRKYKNNTTCARLSVVTCQPTSPS